MMPSDTPETTTDHMGSPSSTSSSTSKLLPHENEHHAQSAPSSSRLQRRDTQVIHRTPPLITAAPSSSRFGATYIRESIVTESNDYQSSDVFLPGPPSTSYRNSDASLSGESFTFPTVGFPRTRSVGGISYVSRSSSISDVVASLPLRQTSLADEALNAPRISRSSTRRSIGREWTRHHWDKVKDLEQESDRARRCSKLSSGFAPLMVFGGLVFVCIGVSAKTNTGKDRVRLQELSTTPLAMGVFMLGLGLFLICTWFGCRRRARQLELKVLHGSRRNSANNDDNVVQSVLAKLYHQATGGTFSRNRPETPTLPGVTLDGVIAYKTPINRPNETSGPTTTSVVRETSV
nr:uncharacterized protein LOC100182279 isoform X2 [Ciona intestinalis]|eukprot:XP_002120998.1 uncharacterized protein LOC100182279 isoform X2 [Ciona intestinalis]